MMLKPTFCLALTCALTLASPSAEARPCVPASPDEALQVDFKDAPLRDVVRFISCAATLNIILEPPALAERTFTLIGSRPLKRQDLFPLLRSALRSAGLIAERRAAYWVIRPAVSQTPSKRRSSRGR